MLRARDAMDRGYARPLDIAALAKVAHVSEAHFIRTFRSSRNRGELVDDDIRARADHRVVDR